MAFQNKTATTETTMVEAVKPAEETVGQTGGETMEENGVFYMAEEAVLGMPRFLENMGEEMLLPPPELGWNHNDLAGDADVSLWSF